jgi:DNA invertase Pin-like site-specific DNA recombinase
MSDGTVLLQEYVNWKDGGCDLHPACPLQRCIEEEPRRRQKRRIADRAGQIKEMRARGITCREIAAAFGVSTRTVQRALEQGGSGMEMQKELSRPHISLKS